MSWDKDFAALGDYYPGSSKRRENPQAEKPPDPPGILWDASPRIYTIDGVSYEFFSIGDLATALNRKPVTIRLWEHDGIIPVINLRSPSEHVSKRHRIYTRPIIEGLIRIAEDEKILHVARPRIKDTQFREKTLELFIELSRKPLYGAVVLDGA